MDFVVRDEPSSESVQANTKVEGPWQKEPAVILFCSLRSIF